MFNMNGLEFHDLSEEQKDLEILLFAVKEINKSKIDSYAFTSSQMPQVNIQIGEDIIHIGTGQNSYWLNEKLDNEGKHSKRRLAQKIIAKGLTEELTLYLEEELIKGM
jgi:hypothetical protein